ncbi:MAG TPA: alkaline phosphatase family protein [Candidatus Eremiobacteraceae bacterium]
MRSSTGIAFSCAMVLALAIAACGGGGGAGTTSVLGGPHPSPSPTQTQSPLSRIQHIVIIELENRSFDSYFGTYPGVNGIPPNAGCNPDPKSGQCVYPWHNTSLTNYGGPHSTSDMFNDIDGGKLDGFIASAENGFNGLSDPSPDDVMGYHTCAEIPVYCDLAAANTLADNNFAASNTWSAIAHLYLVSAWSAKCLSHDPMSCTYSGNVTVGNDIFAWTDITYLLHQHGVSWKFYAYKLVGNGQLGPIYRQGDGEEPGDSIGSGAPATDWNPLPDFDDVTSDNELGNIVPGGNFPIDAKAGLLPSVSWITPGFWGSDHPAVSIAGGQKFVSETLRALDKGPDASSTLVLLTWDEWGGFYDHVIPIQIDAGGYGFRTPLIIIGPMVKHGFIDHQLLTSDSYLKLIEDRFLGGARLDPTTDGRPDSRPDVRETQPGLGDIVNDLGP